MQEGEDDFWGKIGVLLLSIKTSNVFVKFICSISLIYNWYSSYFIFSNCSHYTIKSYWR